MAALPFSEVRNLSFASRDPLFINTVQKYIMARQEAMVDAAFSDKRFKFIFEKVNDTSSIPQLLLSFQQTAGGVAYLFAAEYMNVVDDEIGIISEGSFQYDQRVNMPIPQDKYIFALRLEEMNIAMQKFIPKILYPDDAFDPEPKASIVFMGNALNDLTNQAQKVWQ
jgi:hypothetical protein